MEIVVAAESTLMRTINVKERVLRKLLVRVPSWITPDVLTATRVIMVVPIVFAVTRDYFLLAGTWYCLGALFDLLDGPLARLRRQESSFGKIFDPFADKVIADTTLLALYLHASHPIYAIPFWLMFGEDVFLFVMGFFGMRSRRGSSVWGKWKFSCESLSIILFLMYWGLSAHFILWFAICFGAASIVTHIASHRKP